MTDPGPDRAERPSSDDPVLERQLAALADEVATAVGVTVEDRRRLAVLVPLLDPSHLDASPTPGAPRETGAASLGASERTDPGVIGRRHQELLDADHRHRRGVHYTPAAVAALLVGRALDGFDGDTDPAVAGRPTVCDPTCGGGAFLLAVAEHRRRRGASAAEAVAGLRGIDLDPLAVEVTRAALVLWAAQAGSSGLELVAVAEGVVSRVVVGDALHGAWPDEGRLDAVVGNPPFGGQLARSTARERGASEAARAILGGTSAGYADTAGLFLVRAVGACAPGGRVAMVQPLSFLGSRDAGAVRRRLDQQAVLEEVWLAEGRVFGAAVDVCAPVLRAIEPLSVPDAGEPVRVTRGASGDVGVAVDRSRLAAMGSWAPLVAAAAGVPTVDLGGAPVLGTLARATAGFRDEFYALAPFVTDLGDPDVGPREAGPLPALPVGAARLVTSGLVDPGRTLWGRRTTRLAGTRLVAPVVDVDALRAWAEGPDGDRRLAAWAEARLRPKVVVATQTRVVEAAVDDDGSWWPSVPVVSVVLEAEQDDEEHRWLVAAALSAPPVSAWAAERSAGTAMAAHALKLSARQVVEVPLPVDVDAWREGARLLRLVAPAEDAVVRAERLLATGRALTTAYALPAGRSEAVLEWWARRAGCAQ